MSDVSEIIHHHYYSAVLKISRQACGLQMTEEEDHDDDELWQILLLVLRI